MAGWICHGIVLLTKATGRDCVYDVSDRLVEAESVKQRNWQNKGVLPKGGGRELSGGIGR